MASDGSNSGWSIPWPTLAVLLAAAGGAFYLLPALVSSRPPTTATMSGDALGFADVDARLWQDPFQAAYEHRDGLVKRLGHLPAIAPGQATSPEGAEDYRETLVHGVAGFRQQIVDVLKKADGAPVKGAERPRLKVLAVMVNDGPYVEHAEGRLRTRQAVLSGLGVSGFIPQSGDHVGYFELEWDAHVSPAPASGATATVATGNARPLARLVVPYEWCKANPSTVMMRGTTPRPSAAHPSSAQAVLVLWLRDEAFIDRPLFRLADFVRAALRGPGLNADRLEFSVVGPRSSTSLRALAVEASARLTAETAETLDGMKMFAATPTAADLGLVQDLPLPDYSRPRKMATSVDELVKDAFANAPKFLQQSTSRSVEFWRTIHTDDVVVRELVTELDERRGLGIRWPKPGTVPQQPGAGNNDPAGHVAVVAEWDTVYARELANTFAAEVGGYKPNEFLKGTKPWPYFVHMFTYLRGIDGRLPGAGDNERGQGSGGGKAAQSGGGGGSGGGNDSGRAGETAGTRERPEGLDQSDYVRRLARDLEALDRRLIREHGKGLRAVGVLGTDLFDKLMVLRALRERLPGAVFFTTNLDARMELPSEWQPTHNLVVASGFGLQLCPDFQGPIPPFRDNYQTAVFVATRAAMDNMPVDTFPDRLVLPRVFEIGRGGAHDLSVGRSGIHPPRPDALGWWTGRRRLWAAAALSVLGLFALWALLTSFRTPLPTPRDALTLPVHPLPFFTVTTAGIVAVVWFAWWRQRVPGEPWAFAQGISIWPTEALRLFAASLAVWFLARARLARKANDREIERAFGLKADVSWLWAFRFPTEHWPARIWRLIRPDRDALT